MNRRNLYLWALCLTASLALTAAKPSAKKTPWDGVKPLFIQSCFACHAPQLAADPIPNADLARTRQSCIKSAIGSFPMGDIFPFPGKRDASSQLKKMRSEIASGDMPHWKQNKLGLGLPLAADSRKTILAWIDSEIATLPAKN